MSDGRQPTQRQQKSLEDAERGSPRGLSDAQSGGGRRTILVLLLVTVGLSLLLWMQQHIAQWLRDFFGPSTWTVTP